MSEINSFIVSFCSVSILLGALYMLCPSGNMSLCVKYVFCLCFVCCVLSSVISIPEIDFSFLDGETPQPLTEQNVAVTAQTIFCEALNRENINFRKIMVDTNKLQDGSITISKITVFTTESLGRVMEVLDSDSYEVVVINE